MKRLIIIILSFNIYCICNSHELDSLMIEFDNAIAKDDHDASIRLGLILLEKFGDDNNRAETMYQLARQYNCIGEYTKALELAEKAAEIKRELYGTEHPEYAKCLSNLANYYSNIGDYQKAIEIGTEALVIRKKAFGTEHADYAESLGNIALYYCYFGDYTKSIELGTEALEITKNVLGTENSDYAITLDNLAMSFNYLGNHAKAVELGTKSLEIQKKISGEINYDYAISLSSLAGYYADMGNNSKAIKLGTDALEICQKVLGSEHPLYALSLDNLGTYYNDLGDYDKAIELGTKALEIREKVLGTEHPDYARSLENIGNYYDYLGDYDKAIELGTKALKIREKVLGTEHLDYAMSLNNLAGHYCELGDYRKAIEIYTQALKIFKKNFGSEHSNYALSLSNIGSCYGELGDYSKAIELCSKAVEIKKKVLGAEHPDYALSLGNIGKYYHDLGDYDKSIEICTQALSIIEKAFGEEHPLYAKLLNTIAANYCDLGDYIKAIELGTKVLEIREKVLGTEHPDYSFSLKALATYYFFSDNYDKSIPYLTEAINIDRNHILSLFTNITTAQRQHFWDTKKHEFSTLLPNFVLKSSNPEYTISLYDNSCLFSKGLLLTTETEMHKLIQESGDKKTLQKFEELRNTRLWLNSLYEVPAAERSVCTDSLENVAEQQEAELIKISKTYGDFMHNLKITWKDVQGKLGDKDIAIEFLSFPLLSNDSTIYIALTVKKGYDSPHCITLFEEHQIDNIKKHYKSSETSRFVWLPLAEELNGIENIYFSPSGVLYNIGIESLPDWEDNGNLLNERLNFYRLSSTRELAITEKDHESTGAVVYGGIKYDTDIALMGAPENSRHNILAFNRGFSIDSLGMRGAKWDFLPGTLYEAECIDSVLNASHISVTLITGTDATETSFKALSGAKNRILHIATHGFYWNEIDAELANMNQNLYFLQMGDNARSFIEDKAMTRSGLLFSGAQNTFNGVEIPNGVDDGVLTANEISQLDLRGLYLLVLSACQTGLGDVTGEGVFGLQRGFKKAGAKSIIMSLWEVNDAATQDMMTQFYKILSTGKSKHKAFLQAQQYVKAHDADYSYRSSRMREERPHFAAFIMLDAID